MVLLKDLCGILEVRFTLPCAIIVLISLPFHKVLFPFSEFPVLNYGFYFVFFAIWGVTGVGVGVCPVSENVYFRRRLA